MLAATAGTASTILLAGCSSDETEREDGDAGNGGDSGGGGDSTTADSGGSGGGDANQTTQSSGNSVEILNHEWYEEDFSAGVRGTIENTTDEELSYVEISVYFLDSDGTQIGEGLDNFSDLAGGRTAEFDAMYVDDDPSRVEEYEIEAEVTDF